MPKLKINEHHHIDIDHIGSIEYEPAPEGVRIPTGPIKYGQSDDEDPESTVTIPGMSSPTIELKSGRTIDLRGEEADAVWQDYCTLNRPAVN